MLQILKIQQDPQKTIQQQKIKQKKMLSRQNNQINDLQRIRMLQTRMRNRGKTTINQQSFRSLKSTDSKKMPQFNNKLIVFEEQSNGVFQQEHAPDRFKLQQQVKNNHKITDYFHPLPLPKKQQPSQKQQSKTQQKPTIPPIPTPSSSPPSQLPPQHPSHLLSKPSTTPPQQHIKQQNRALKQKLRIKQQNFNIFKIKIKKDILDSIITIHNIKKNQLKKKISINKVRLGQYHIQKKGGDFWVDGIQIIQIKSKIQTINKQKQQLQKCKKNQSKKSNKQYNDDPQQWKNTLVSQMYFLTRQQMHLHQTLKKLQQQKILHIKQYKLLYDQEHSKYGKIDLNVGTTVWPKIGQYQLLGLLGKGGFSQVYKAFDTQQLREVAVKLHELYPQWNGKVKQSFIKHAMRQEGVHKLLNHPNIVKLYGTVQIDQNAFCTILQYCEGPDLSYYLKKHKRLPQKQSKMIIKQVINAIKYLHQLPQKVIHYDLKPQNIMFHKGKVKITDFGLCKTTNDQIIQLTSQGVGTYWYLPPQCFVTDQKPVITPKVDVWSIGVIYFQMLYGEKPFGNQMSQMRILNQGIMLKASNVNFPNPPKCIISNESKQFIKACLKANVQQRLDIRGIACHPLFEKR